ncbi:hypothetical protein ACJJTC_007322 [Scirpophaga incertulas]
MESVQRIDCLSSGEAAGVTAATLAARAALRDCGAAGATATATTGTCTTTAASTAELRLYAARVLRELAGPRRPAARWALVCAVLDRPPPADFNQSELRCPPEELVREAEVRCEQRCEELERGWRAARGGRAGGEDWEGGDDAAPDAALAAAEPGLAEWAAARVELSGPRALAQAHAHAARAADAQDMTAEERRSGRRRLARWWREHHSWRPYWPPTTRAAPTSRWVRAVTKQ